MKKVVGILGGMAGLGGTAYLLRKQKRKELRRKYNLLDEIPDKDLFALPGFICNPTGFKMYNRILTGGQGEFVQGVSRTQRYIDSFDNQKIELYIYEPEDSENEVLPCLVYFHGGAYFIDYLPGYHRILANYAKNARCRVVSVRYRTLVEVPYKSSLKDCYQGLLWTYDNAKQLGIDKERIAIGGDSAGGTYAAAVTHLVREWNGPRLCYQMLIYPATDMSVSSASAKRCVDSPGWNSACSRNTFKYIIPSLDDETRPYFNLIEQKNFEGLCDAYVEVEENDCLHDDGEKYAQLLKESGYDVYYNDMKGTYHGYDQNQNLQVSKDVMKLRCELLRKAFGTEQEGGVR